MQTSRFQLGLIGSSEAVGYPAGAAVSCGSNPLWAKAGEVSGDYARLFTCRLNRCGLTLGSPMKGTSCPMSKSQSESLLL